MSFLSKLHMDGEDYNILDFSMEFNQESDTTGKPVGIPKGGRIKVVIEATQNTNFLSWMVDANQTKDGKITFFRRDAMSKMRELSFTKAYCLRYLEQFTSTTTVPMQITMEFTAKEMTFGDTKYSNNWISLD
jgi:hypothetical protein